MEQYGVDTVPNAEDSLQWGCSYPINSPEFKEASLHVGAFLLASHIVLGVV